MPCTSQCNTKEVMKLEEMAEKYGWDLEKAIQYQDKYTN